MGALLEVARENRWGDPRIEWARRGTGCANPDRVEISRQVGPPYRFALVRSHLSILASLSQQYAQFA